MKNALFMENLLDSLASQVVIMTFDRLLVVHFIMIDPQLTCLALGNQGMEGFNIEQDYAVD